MTIHVIRALGDNLQYPRAYVKQRKNQQSGYIYAVFGGELTKGKIKFGKTINLESRMNVYKTCYGGEAKCIFIKSNNINYDEDLIKYMLINHDATGEIYEINMDGAISVLRTIEKAQ